MKPCVCRELSAKSVAALFALASLLFSALVIAGNVTTNNRAGLYNAAGSSPTTSIIFGVPGVTFANTENAVNNFAVNATMNGSTASGFAGSVAQIAADIIGTANANKSGLTDAVVGARVNPFTIPGMTFIDGSGATRTSSSPFNDSHWLTTSNGLEFNNVHFRNVKVENTLTSGSSGMVNGLIGSISGNTSDITMGDLTGNAFSNINVTFHGYLATQYLAGGGVVGLRATGESSAVSASASIGNIIGNVFRDITVITDKHVSGTGSAYIESGGIIGVDAVSSPDTVPGHASIRSLSNNLFTGIKVESEDIILGGGLVGVNNNSQVHDSATTYSEILAVSGNIFGDGTLNTTDPANTADIYVRSVFSLRGGGVIGVNGLSNAAVRLDSLTGNVFAGIYVDTDSYLKGGGIIGVQSNDGGDGKYTPGTLQVVGAYLDNVQENLFLNQRVDAGTYLMGGGIVGVRSNEGLVALNRLENNVFKGLIVNAGDVTSNYLDGGGIVGVSALQEAAITGVRNNYFDGLSVTVTGTSGHLYGGGVLGASSSNIVSGTNNALGVVEVDRIDANQFSNITVTVGGNLSGGGVVGANGRAPSVSTSNDYYALIPNLTGNLFSGIGVTVTENITGGGVVGAHTDHNTSSTGSGTAGSLNLSNNRFANVTVTSANLSGGGIIGFDAAGSTNAYMETVSGNDFNAPTVATSGSITGGGVLGVRSGSGIGYIDTITGNWFRGANITAGTHIDGGGLVGATGNYLASAPQDQLYGIGLIDSSVFTDNTVRANNGQIMGGAVYTYGSFVGMTIRDSLFINNEFFSTDTTNSRPKVYGTVAVDTGLAGPDAANIPNTLRLTATAGNTTLFQNNLITEGVTSRANPPSLYFGAIRDSGGNLDDPDSDAQLIVSPQAGGTVALYDPILVNQTNDPENPASGTGARTFAMTVEGRGGEFFWGGNNAFYVADYVPTTYSVNNTVTFETSSMTTLLSGMTLNASAHAFNLDAGGRINVMGANALTINSADFDGHLHFNLMAAQKNDLSTTLLTITSAAAPDYTDISGATVSLSNFAAGAPLNPGDEFYLINTGAQNQITGDPANDTVYARQGMTRGYYFIIDKNPTQNSLDASAGGPNESQLLVARLVSAPLPALETRILAEGRVASLALLGQNANWLADHSYQQADLALRQGENRAFFGGMDYANVRMDTGATVDYQGYTLVAGEAMKREKEDQSLLLGGFFEAGYGDYDVHGKFGHPEHPHMKGDGKLRYYGLGLMARQRWDSGFRLEGSLRGGRMENKFHSRDLADVDGTTARYKLHVPWFGAHLGAAYEWQLNERDSLDMLLRYYWARQNGKTVHLNHPQEEVRFLKDDSQRLRLGGRYTRTRDAHRAWYLGLAYEYEFDHRANAKSIDGKIDVPDPRGGGFVGEIGMILHPKNHDRLSAEFGLQGYTGKREGFSGGFRLGWKF
ncbi:MAG: hypothetical protein LBU11_09945 [Zoogloeaceae bacterium]|jgi:hypothetical protein|nr:hypothetical protein [Zoogloeaceae bacterium]